MTTDGESGRLIFKHNFTELEGSVVYCRKNVLLRLQHLLHSFVFIYMDFKSNFVLLSRVFFFALSGKLFYFVFSA